MSFRTKLLLIVVVTILASISLVAFGLERYTQAAFEELDTQRTEALVAQFNKEFVQLGDEVAHQVKNIAGAFVTERMAIDLARPDSDQSLYLRDANGAAQEQGLDYVEFVNHDLTLLSSVQEPSHVGNKIDWLAAKKDWNDTPAFLRKEELVDGPGLSLSVVRTKTIGNKSLGDRTLYIIGGRRMDQNFLASLVLPTGTRALFYQNLGSAFAPALLTDANGLIAEPERFQPLIEQIKLHPQPVVRTIDWSDNPGDSETFHAIPLLGRDKDLLGIFLVGSSRKDMVMLTRRIIRISALVGAAAMFVGLLMAAWISARITKPLEELAEGVRDVASGRWDTRIDVRGADEIGQLATAFNEMTRTLVIQREKLVQTERVAAWRELASRLAHELRNPLFPMQITVENLQRARRLEARQFLEVFHESTNTLKEELANLNVIVGRFSDFSKMPVPRFSSVNLNESLRHAVRLFAPQFTEVGKPTITPEFFVAEPLPEVEADPDLLHRAFQNLILNAMDSMPAGGTLTVRTAVQNGYVRIEIADTGKGLTPEECARLFTPYYTTKVLGTGLGLAIVQSIVSDHHGMISVSSEEGQGATFRIDLPQRQPARSAKSNGTGEPSPKPSSPTFVTAD